VTEGPARDVLLAAVRFSREDFVANHPWLFLVGEPVIHQPKSPMRTLTNLAPALRKLDTVAPGETTPNDTAVGELGLIVAPIRKRQDVFPEMITVGRTANNDVVLPDATVSKFHAYFRTLPSGNLELVDAGSRNGTKVMGRALQPKQSIEVNLGTRVRFGSIDLIVRSAGETWDGIRKRG
jgi:hypothetical protein